MSTSFSTETDTASLNGREAEAPTSGDMVDVNVEMQEAIGIGILGFLFFLVLLAMLRSMRRERKLLERMAELRAQLAEKSTP